MNYLKIKKLKLKNQKANKEKLKLSVKIELYLAVLLLTPLLLAHAGMSFQINVINEFLNQWVQLSLASIIYFYFGRSFWKAAYLEIIKRKRFGMHSLVWISTTIAYIYGIFLLSISQFHGNNMIFFEITGAIIVFTTVGETISQHMQKRALVGLKNLMSLQEKKITKINIETKEKETIDYELLQVNDYLLVPKGAKIPTDGIIVEGTSLIDESMMTGESKWVDKKINDEVIGGTINQDNPIIIKVTKVGKDTVLANILSAVEKVQSQKPKVQKIVDIIAAFFTPFIIILSIFTIILHFFIGTGDNFIAKAITYGIATLVIACPCALGIATPLALSVGTNKAVKEGIIYRKVDSFEKINKIKAICFDKTGTITTGKLKIIKIIGDKKYLDLAINLENYSTHPVAYAFKNYKSIKTHYIFENVQEIANIGLKTNYKKQNIIISSLNYAQKNNYHIEQNYLKEIQNHQSIYNFVALSINQKVVTIFVLSDEIRDDAKSTINKFLKLGLEVFMISGDNAQNVKYIAKKVGIKKYFAQVKPIEKAEIVKKIQKDGKQVAFVGDGINDIVALEQSDLGIAIGSGSEIAINSGSLVLMKSNLYSVYRAILLTKKTKNNIYANLIWAFAYNLFAIPIAISGLIGPTIALLAMLSSQIFVVTNSLIFKFRNYKNQ